MMSHQGGLASIDATLPIADVLAVTPIVGGTRRADAAVGAGTGHGYHALTYGWLAGELVRRVDGRTIGRLLRRRGGRTARPRLLYRSPRRARSTVSMLESAPPPTDPEALAMMMQVAGPGTMGFRALFLNGTMFSLDPSQNLFNTREVHATEMPAANGITNARSLSRMYAATIGEVDGVRLVGSDVVDQMRAEQVNGPDKSLVADTRFGYGFMLHSDVSEMFQDGSFGHAGAGGSLGYADPTAASRMAT